MKIWGAIFNLIAIVIIVMLLGAFYNITTTLDRDFDTQLFNQAVEYATESAFRSAIEHSDVGIEYSDINNSELNTGKILDKFSTMMCLNYNIALSDYNKKQVIYSVAAMALTTGDGYYILETRRGDYNNSTEYVKHWSLKRPYIYDYSGTRKYALNVLTKKAISVDADGTINNVYVAYPLSGGADMVLVNDIVTKAIMTEIKNNNINNDEIDFRFLLPSKTSADGVNPMNSPGLIVLVNSMDFVSKEKISVVSVSGYKVVAQEYIIGFRDMTNGRLYYCYENQMNEEDINTRYVVDNYFKTKREAAEMGYSPHFEIMSRKRAS